MTTEGKSLLLAFGLVTLLGFHVQAQRSTEQEGLIRSQTEYYQAQTSKLTQKTSVWQSLRDNPASAIGILGALVALISFFFNYRVTLKHQRDTQFYEALKRFGDKDSSTVRLSAAVLIGEIASKQGRDYLDTAIDQLTGGVLLEQSPVVLNSIADSVGRLADSNPSAVISKLYELNFVLEEELVINLAKYFQVLRKQAGENDLTSNVVASRFWSEAIVVTRIPNAQLELWTQANRQTFYRTLLSAAHRLDGLSVQRLIEYMAPIEEALELSSERIRLNDFTFGRIYLGMFLPEKKRKGHRHQMDTVLENFLLKRAGRRGYKSPPSYWWDLHKGRPSLRKNSN